MTILSAELQRIRHRRATRFVAAAAGLTIVAAGGLTFLNHSAAAPDMAEANRQAAFNTSECLSWASTDPSVDASELDAYCFNDPQWFVVDRNFHMQRLLTSSYGGVQPWSDAKATALEPQGSRDIEGVGTVADPARGLQGDLPTLGVLAALVAAMLGATFIGSDWRSGVIESQLVRSPNRKALVAAKLGAASIVCGVGAMVVTGAITAAMVPAAIWRGDFTGTGTGFWLEAAAMWGRIGVAAAAFALIGGGMAMLFRNTVAGVGGVLLAFIAGGFLSAITGRWPSFLSVPSAVNSWLTLGDVTYDFVVPDAFGGNSWYELSAYGYLTAGLLLAALTTILVTSSGASFLHRDVS